MLDNDLVASALDELAGVRHRRADAAVHVAHVAGLYAVYGDERAWSDLSLTPAFDDQPLYVGKAERSLNGRDVRTHFAAGKTGSSTVRRSLAALLFEALDLSPVPRNPSKPDGSANYALEAEGDARLSEWMDQRLTLATWASPVGVVLDEVETELVRRLRPPLNLDKVGEPRAELRAARRRMATIARSWAPDSDIPRR
ncbi:GIY-YIG nuclease family protein [uncultured Nocardioides sp.]|uniref:GIY-YIG nuclease family protein n=1 Tax=uncultured Nocardioides sp. TaxID=198441 RepID=UPI000C693EAD|nr:hypothetical protein [Nocardioides sp.]|tara:strand:+ start:1617 stop:2210 length:594 start_codon:yes stop_codon:yes gene_type:complete